MNDTDYSVVKALIATGCPADGVVIDIAYDIHTNMYTYIVYSDDLRRFPAAQSAAVMRWLYDISKQAYQSFGISIRVAREAHVQH